MKRIKLCTGLLLLFSLTFSAQSNIFLQRSFWKGKPTIEEINKNIAEGNNISAFNSNAFDPVVYALLEKVDTTTIQHLLTFKGNEVNKLTHDGRTYLFWAAYKNNLDMVKYLIKNGAKTDIIDDKGYSVFNFAASTGNTNITLYDFLIEQGATPKTDTDHYGANALLLAAPSAKDLTFIDYLLSIGLDIHSKDSKGNGVVNYAAKSGNQKLINYMIKKGVSYRELNKEGGNAFIFASKGTRNKNNSLEFYWYLERLGINPKITTQSGKNPLHFIAARVNNKSIINYFLKKGNDINQVDSDGNTPFINAARSNNLATITYLYPMVQDINHQNKKGQSALTQAMSRNSLLVVDFLVQKGADVTVLDSRGNNLAYYLMNSYNPNRFEEFKLKSYAITGTKFSLTTPQKDGSTLYHLAIDKNNLKLLEWVKEQKIDINAKDRQGNTALHKAAMSSNDGMMLQFLVLNGADISSTTEFGETAYDLAKENELLQKNEIDLGFLKK